MIWLLIVLLQVDSLPPETPPLEIEFPEAKLRMPELVLTPAPDTFILYLPLVPYKEYLLPEMLETPLRMPKALMATPANATVLYPTLENYEEIFLSYPFIDTLIEGKPYFRGSGNVLFLKDGVPVASFKDICYPSIERVEILGENARFLYGDYDAVINVVTKRFEGGKPYSRFKFLSNPSHIQFEFGRSVWDNFDVYLTGDLNDKDRFSCNVGYRSRYADLCVYYDSVYTFKGSLFTGLNVTLKKDYYTANQYLRFKNQEFLIGYDYFNEEQAFFVQDYWEVLPLMYIVPGARYQDDKVSPKLSLGWSPALNLTIYANLSCEQINCGFRWLESSINVFRQNDADIVYGLETRLVTPGILGCRGIVAWGVRQDPESEWEYDWTIMGEFKHDFKIRNIGIYILGDWRSQTTRFELRIIDARFYYKLVWLEPSYGLSWEFWD